MYFLICLLTQIITKSAVILSKRHHGKLPHAWCSRRHRLVSSRPDRTRLRQQQLLLSQISWHCNPRSSLIHNSEGNDNKGASCNSELRKGLIRPSTFKEPGTKPRTLNGKCAVPLCWGFGKPRDEQPGRRAGILLPVHCWTVWGFGL